MDGRLVAKLIGDSVYVQLIKTILFEKSKLLEAIVSLIAIVRC